MIAALFVHSGGVYFGLPGVDPWDERRDARLYAGPHPVVAHPPCERWTNFAALNFKRWGGEHNRPGNDGGCFAYALHCVRHYGGVLEHPAGSKAWGHFALREPPRAGGWVNAGDGMGWTCEVSQSAYGHLARKRTWLYAVATNLPELDWRSPDGTHQVGWFDRKKPVLRTKQAAATPPPFRDLLIDIAATARAAR